MPYSLSVPTRCGALTFDRRTTYLMLAISSYESGGFRPDVDSIEATGDCREVAALPNGLRPVGPATEDTVKRMVCRSRCLSSASILVRAA